MNSDLAAGYVKIACDDRSGMDESREGLAEEWRELTWKDDTKMVENPLCSNHICDAALYSWRECFGYLQPAIELSRKAEKAAKGVDTASKKDDMSGDEDDNEDEGNLWGGLGDDT
jgi:hypothetical protein